MTERTKKRTTKITSWGTTLGFLSSLSINDVVFELDPMYSLDLIIQRTYTSSCYYFIGLSESKGDKKAKTIKYTSIFS